jgi:hypothetical protein
MFVNKLATKPILVIYIIIVLIILLAFDITKANQLISLTIFRCDGGYRTVTFENNSTKVYKKVRSGDIPRSYLYKDSLYFFDNKTLISYNLISKKYSRLLDLKVFLNDEYIPWLIGSVDQKVIYFSVMKYKRKTSNSNQKYLYSLYSFNKQNQSVEEIKINEFNSPYFSVYNEKVYFKNKEGQICVFDGFKIKSLDILGDSPSVSPNGKKIAYLSYEWGFTCVKIYNINSKRKFTLIKSFGPKSVTPIFRWHADNRFIALKKKSDLKAMPLYIFNISNKKLIEKIDESKACNWFFYNES